jgi:competence protein ComEC
MFSIITLGYFCVYIEKPTKEDFSIVESLAQNTNTLIAEIFTKHLQSDTSALCKALCIADKSDLTSTVKKDFSRAGASHILAVSGMHVGIIFTAISTLIGLISQSRKFSRIASIVAICFLWFYAFICGLQPSIVRACTMFTIPIIGKLLKRDSSSLNSLLFTAFCMVIYDYTNLFNIGFQLSFLAVAGILLFQEKIFNIIQLQNKILIWLWSLTSVSIAAQITTLPLTIYYFHNIPVLSLISNLFVVPLSTLLIYFSGGLILFNLTNVSNIISLILNKLSYYLNLFIEEISCTPFATIENINISIFQVATLYLIILITKYFLDSKKPVCVIWILSLIILFLGYDIIRLLFL